MIKLSRVFYEDAGTEIPTKQNTTSLLGVVNDQAGALSELQICRCTDVEGVNLLSTVEALQGWT